MIRSVAVVLLTLWLAVPVMAKKPMGIVDLMTVKTIDGVKLSPDDSRALFTQAEADWKQNKMVTHVYMAEIASGKHMQMTGSSAGETQPAWSPDGSQFAFLSTRNGSEAQIFLQNISGGEALQLTKNAGPVRQLRWSADGKSIYFLAAEPLGAALKAAQDEKDDAYLFEKNYRPEHLWRITLSDRAEKKIIDGDFSVRGFDFSTDGSRAVYISAPSPILEDSQWGEVYALDVKAGTRRRLTNNRTVEGGVSISPDGSTISFTCSCNGQYQEYYNDQIFTASFAGDPKPLLNNFSGEVLTTKWAGDSKSIYFTANMGVHVQLFNVTAADGTWQMLTEGAKRSTISTFDLNVKTGSIAYLLADPSRPGEIYFSKKAPFAPKRVTNIYDYLDVEYELPKVEVVTWKGADGRDVEGILTYPIGYRAGQKVALVAQIHGGPAASDKVSFSGWSSYTPVLAGKGYAILQPNYRGSTGYGNDFLRDMVEHYFQNADKDVMTGVDSLIAKGVADPDHLIIMGWSGGGHMTNWLVTHTTRFKAAAAGAGASNWISMYAQSDHREFRTPWFGASPWAPNAPLGLYLDHSPIKYIAKAKTPTLLLVGQEDPRVPLPQSVEMYRGLKENGVPTELVVFPREPHGLQELRHRLTKVNKELGWFEKYVFGREYTSEKAPGGRSE